MAGEIVGQVLKYSKARGAAWRVLVCLAEHADKDSRQCYPSLAVIAAETHMSVRHVQKQMPVLVTLGELRKEERPQTSHLYTVLLKETREADKEYMARVRSLKHHTDGSQPCDVAGEQVDTRRVNTLPPTGEDPDTRTGGEAAALTVTRNRPRTVPGASSGSATLDAIPPGNLARVATGRLAEEILEPLERIRGVRGNRARGKNKRYSCKLTLAELKRLASSLLKERPADIVLAALENFSWGDGFTSGRAFVQKLALRKWVLMQKPPLLDETIALLAKVDADAVLAEQGLDRFIPFARHRDDDFRRYITSDDLFRLHDALAVG